MATTQQILEGGYGQRGKWKNVTINHRVAQNRDSNAKQHHERHLKKLKEDKEKHENHLRVNQPHKWREYKEKQKKAKKSGA